MQGKKGKMTVLLRLSLAMKFFAGLVMFGRSVKIHKPLSDITMPSKPLVLKELSTESFLSAELIFGEMV